MSHNAHAQGSWHKPHSAPATDSGQALPLALIALAAGFLLVTVFALALGVYVKISAASATDLLDYYAADAGIERAVAPLVADPAAYPSPTMLTLTLNNRPVTVSITPGASQTIPRAGNTMTATVTTYVVTSAVSELTIKARAEARHTEGQVGGSVRITAWKVGQ